MVCTLVFSHFVESYQEEITKGEMMVCTGFCRDDADITVFLGGYFPFYSLMYSGRYNIYLFI